MAEVVTAGWFRRKRRKSGSARHRWRRTELLHAGDVAVAGERRLQEGAQCLLGDLHADPALTEGDDVRVVVLPRQPGAGRVAAQGRSEEHTSEIQSLMRTS